MSQLSKIKRFGNSILRTINKNLFCEIFLYVNYRKHYFLEEGTSQQNTTYSEVFTSERFFYFMYF